MKKFLSLLLLPAALLCACTNKGVMYQPYAQLTPTHIRKIAVRPFINRTEVFALEDRLTLRLNDEFLKDGSYQIVSEAVADGVIIGQITRYLMVPLQYDNQLIPTTYRMDIWLRVQLFDMKKGVSLWEEPALVGSHIYSAATLPGGMTEEEARTQVWEKLSRSIVKRTTDGFGSVWSESKRTTQQETNNFVTITE